jgi:hypothetical protein
VKAIDSLTRGRVNLDNLFVIARKADARGGGRGSDERALA